ncbi:helix-turn-helix domain-containing protein, partial [Aerosakkonemataceae cyanobacterium BLCC-F154]
MSQEDSRYSAAYREMNCDQNLRLSIANRYNLTLTFIFPGYTVTNSRINREMLIGLKVRLYPNKEQQTALAQNFGCCRFVWNY